MRGSTWLAGASPLDGRVRPHFALGSAALIGGTNAGGLLWLDATAHGSVAVNFVRR